MNSDFHYYGTYTAARAAGLTPDDANIVANAADFVDYFDSSYWSYWNIVEGGTNKKLATFNDPQLSTQIIGLKLAKDYDKDIWNAFHFPPGNLPYDFNKVLKRILDVYQGKQHIVRTDLNDNVKNKALLCRPYSKFISDMIFDTFMKYKAMTNHSDLSVDIKPKERFFSKEGTLSDDLQKKTALMFLGIRMHVLADSWAHQDFTGNSDENINSAGFFNNVYSKTSSDSYKKVTFDVNPLNNNDFSAAPYLPAEISFSGHGQMGHYPDYGWMKILYPAGWMNKDGLLERNNPKEYQEAWSVIASVIAMCIGNDKIIEIQEDIKGVIEARIELSNDKFSAAEKCGKKWAELIEAKYGIKEVNLPREEHCILPSEFSIYRWGNKPQSIYLGVLDGLPSTRLGSVNIIQYSILHLFEIASSTHFQWYINWAESANNKDYKLEVKKQEQTKFSTTEQTTRQAVMALSTYASTATAIDRLLANEYLEPEMELISSGNKYKLVYQSDNNLVIYRMADNRAVWATNTHKKKSWRAIMQSDGNFTIFKAEEKPAVWQTNTSHHEKSSLIMQDDGDLVIIDSNGNTIWTSNTSDSHDKLYAQKNQYLEPGDELMSVNGNFKLTYQNDGNLVIYRLADNDAIWLSNTHGHNAWRTYMQPDGNLVIYEAPFKPIWQTGTAGYNGCVLIIQDNGRLIINDKYEATIWASSDEEDN